VLSPPHLVYKWRREIQETVAGAKVWVLNGPDTLVKLIKLREQLGVPARGQEFFVLGACGCGWVSTGSPSSTCGARATATWRVPGLRPGHHRPRRRADQPGRTRSRGVPPPVQPLRRTAVDADPTAEPVRQRPVLGRLKALKRIPTIGEVTAQKLMQKFGDGFLASMLGDNIHEFINLMDGNGELVFSDRQAHRMERAMANMEFGFGEGGYQPSEFIKATCRKARSTCSSPTRRTSTRTAAAPRARPWACWRRRRARPCCSPAR
jgi:hypothetical protein